MHWVVDQSLGVEDRISGVLQSGWIRQMCLCVREARMNQASRRVILEENQLPSALAMFPTLRPNLGDNQIKTLSWPAQPPDLNPTENLWNVIGRKVDGQKPSSKAELLECLRQE